MITIEQKLALDNLVEYIISTPNGTIVYNERRLGSDVNGNSRYQYSVFTIKQGQLINITSEVCTVLGYKRLKNSLKFNTQDSPYDMHGMLLKALENHVNKHYTTLYQVID